MPKQATRFDEAKTSLLAEARNAAGVAQQEAAHYFGLKDRGSIHAWESGYSSPPVKHRARFFLYLLDKLGLRKQPAVFLELWDTVMVNIWEWEPVGEAELTAYLPHSLTELSGRRSAIFLAPPKAPFDLLGRDAALHDLRRRLFALQATSLYGLPGVGKTALAITIANDREVLQQFRNGVLWARLGRQADVLGELGKWGLALGLSVQELAALTTIPQRAEAVHRQIGLQRMLLVMDDVWDVQTGLAFQLGGPNCARLYTTRFPGIAGHLAGDGAVAVAELDARAGLQLFLRLAPMIVQRELNATATLVRQVGGLPLALVLLANRLRDAMEAENGRRADIPTLLQQLQATHERMKIAAPQAPLQRHPSLPDDALISLQAVIALSYQALSSDLQTALRAFALFPPKPNSFSTEAALFTAGSSTLPAAPTENSPAIQPDEALVRGGLVEITEVGRLMLHQTIADYALLQPPLREAVERMARFFISKMKAAPDDYAFVEQEQTNILAALNLAAEHNLPTLYVDGVEVFYPFAENLGLYAAVDPLLALAAEKAQAGGEIATAVKLMCKRSVAVHQGAETSAAEERRSG